MRELLDRTRENKQKKRSNFYLNNLGYLSGQKEKFKLSAIILFFKNSIQMTQSSRRVKLQKKFFW